MRRKVAVGGIFPRIDRSVVVEPRHLTHDPQPLNRIAEIPGNVVVAPAVLDLGIVDEFPHIRDHVAKCHVGFLR